MTQEIINRFSLNVIHQFTKNNPSFSESLQLTFNPDAMIVRQITYGGVTDDQNISAIQTSLVGYGDGIIGHIFSNTLAEIGPPAVVNTPLAMTVCPSAQYPIIKNKTTSATQFTLLVPFNGQLVPNTLADGQLFLTLEFVEFKK